MRYNVLGNTGLFVSELCLGAMTFGGKGFWEVVGKLGAKEAESLVGTALDAGGSAQAAVGVLPPGLVPVEQSVADVAR